MYISNKYCISYVTVCNTIYLIFLYSEKTLEEDKDSTRPATTKLNITEFDTALRQTASVLSKVNVSGVGMSKGKNTPAKDTQSANVYSFVYSKITIDEGEAITLENVTNAKYEVNATTTMVGKKGNGNSLVNKKNRRNVKFQKQKGNATPLIAIKGLEERDETNKKIKYGHIKAKVNTGQIDAALSKNPKTNEIEPSYSETSVIPPKVDSRLRLPQKRHLNRDQVACVKPVQQYGSSASSGMSKRDPLPSIQRRLLKSSMLSNSLSTPCRNAPAPLPPIQGSHRSAAQHWPYEQLSSVLEVDSRSDITFQLAKPNSCGNNKRPLPAITPRHAYVNP